MGLVWAPYYQFARVNGGSPDIKNWAVTDSNWNLSSLLFKKFEQHHHNGATPINYPGYNVLNPATPATPLLTLASTGGSIPGGTTVGVRLSFVDQYGLETQGAPEIDVQTPGLPTRPSGPVSGTVVSTPVPGAVTGGTWVYALTKGQGTGETTISDVTVVPVPFNTTATSSYTVPLQFNPISSYSDGTDSLYLYRSTGFDANFVLLTQFAATPGGQYSSLGLQNNVASYTDTGTILDPSRQPPQSNTFGMQNLLTIDWSKLSIPGTAYRMRVYLTQQKGTWGIQNLFQDYAIINPTTPFPNSVQYFGTETLAIGYPLDFTQIPYGAPLVNLTTEATGAPIYTQQANAMGYQTLNFLFPVGNSNATPIFGAAYVDGSIGGNGQLKVCLSTPAGANAPGVFTTLAGVGSGYAHPLAESGGHTASHIGTAPTYNGTAGSGPTQDLFNNIVATPVGSVAALYRKPVQNIYKVTATPADLQNSTAGAWLNMADMTTLAQWPSGINPVFAGQWFDFDFQAWCTVNAGTTNGQILSAVLVINGVQMSETYTSFGGTHVTQSTTAYGQLSFNYATPITRSNNVFQVQWLLSQAGQAIAYGGNVAGTLPRRFFMINEMF